MYFCLITTIQYIKDTQSVLLKEAKLKYLRTIKIMFAKKQSDEICGMLGTIIQFKHLSSTTPSLCEKSSENVWI